MLTLINMGIVNASFRSESQISGYQKDIEIEIICFVNTAQVMLFLTYVLYWYKFQLNGVFCC